MSNTDIRNIIGDRIRERRNLKGWTAREAAANASMVSDEKISTGRWQNWECGQRSPGVELYPVLAKVLDTTPQYLAAWTTEAGIGIETNKYTVANVNPGGEEDELAFHVGYLKSLGYSENAVHFMRAKDDSLAPDIQRGDLVLFDKKDTDIHHGIYALNANGETFIRRVRREIGGNFTVYGNDDKHTPAQTFSAQQFAAFDVIGRFIFTGRFHEHK